MLAETRPLGAEIDRMFKIRAEIRDHKAAATEKQAVYDALEKEVMERLKAEGATKAAGALASASVGEKTVAKVEDWDAFYKFIRRHSFFHLLERRPANAAYLELLASRKQPIPGVVSSTFPKLSLRTTA